MRRIIEAIILIATMTILCSCETSCNCGGNNYAESTQNVQSETML